jgi:phospholipase/carboxylesterase
MMPLKMAQLPDLTYKSIFIATGRLDRVIPSAGTRRLVHALKKAGATVKVFDAAAGHELTAADVEAARAWMSQGKWQQCTAAPSSKRDAA